MEYHNILNSSSASERTIEINKQPRFEVLLLVLSFYQNYRELEHYMNMHLPVPEHSGLFSEEMYSSEKERAAPSYPVN